MPLTILRKTPNDFSPPYKKVIAECTYANAYKVAWESRRFWEQDYNIYGGLEFVNNGCSPIWFPSANLFSERGVLVTSSPFGKLPIPDKFAESRKTAPGHGKELEKPLYVGWGRISYNEGSWIRAYSPPLHRPPRPRVQAPPSRPAACPPIPPRPRPPPTQLRNPHPAGRPHLLRRCHVSHIVAWQEGAALSNRRAVQMISDKVQQARLASTAVHLA